MSEGVHQDTLEIADIIGRMKPLEGSKLLASMDFFVRERVLRVIEYDQRSPTKATLLREGMAQLTKA
jgi:hypothetical protein